MERLSAPLVSIYETDQQTCPANVLLEPCQNLDILRNKLRFKEKILRRIPGNGELRSNDQFCSRGGKPLVGANDLLKIPAQISDGGVDLSEPDLHAVPRKLCAARQS